MDLKTLAFDALIALRNEKQSAFNTLIALETPTTDQVDEAEALATDLEAIHAEESRRTTAARRFEALKTKKFAKDDDESTEESGDSDKVTADADEVNDNTEKGASGTAEGEVHQQEEAEVVEPGNVVDGEGGQTPNAQSSSTVAELAAQTSRPPKPTRSQGPVVITAAANVEGYATGQNIDLLDVAKAAIARARGFSTPQGNGEGIDLHKFGTAMFRIDYPEELTLDAHKDNDEVIRNAMDETRLPGGSLTAAGGWCAPSETIYDLTQDATTEGMVSLPEVAVKRGGLRWAVSPTFADFYANPGFIQTEAQAIAGTTKPCVEVDCPDFVEARLDAEGLCIKVPILTNAGYPEYVRNFVEGTLVAHQHWINANVIGRMVTAAGAARVITGLGSTLTDTLEGLELLADQTRQKYRLSMNRTLEVVLPFWVRGAVRSDLARRNGVPFQQVTDAQISAFFRAQKLNVQFVYDWQPLDETAEVYPDSFNALMYPAGTFIKGTADVINLSTVYDAASLATNTYTGLFTEQGFMVAQQKFHADLITLPVCNAGRTGAADLTCATA